MNTLTPNPLRPLVDIVLSPVEPGDSGGYGIAVIWGVRRTLMLRFSYEQTPQNIWAIDMVNRCVVRGCLRQFWAQPSRRYSDLSNATHRRIKRLFVWSAKAEVGRATPEQSCL